MNRHIVTLLFSLLSASLCAQRLYTVKTDSTVQTQIEASDTVQLMGKVNNLLAQLWTDGFLYSSLDSLSGDTIYLFTGPRYDLEILEISIKGDNGFSFRSDSHELRNSLNQELRKWSDQGYPLAKFVWDSIAFLNNKYKAFLTVDPGPQIKWGDLIIEGNTKIDPEYLAELLQIEKGLPYSQLDYELIDERIKRLEAVALTEPPGITFDQGKAIVYLKLKKSEVDQFEGIIGVLPNASDQNLLITGFVDLSLNNLFRSGKQLDFEWNRFDKASQSLEIGYDHPFFLGSPVGIEGQFSLLKQDTTFVTSDLMLGVSVFTGALYRLQLYYENQSGNQVSGENSTGVYDFSQKWYGLTFGHLYHDRPLIFRETSRYQLGVGVGDKKIDEVLSETQRDSLDTRSTSLKIFGDVQHQIFFGKATAFYLNGSGQWFRNSSLVQNELERIGGIKSLRGFNENFFFASSYLLLRSEIRQYFERTSYLMAFYDHFLYQKFDPWRTASGFGVGLSLGTDSGLFNFAIALGRSEQISIDPANIKIHFGFISTF